MIIQCVVACMCSEGPVFFPCKVEIPEEEYDVGTHYDMAEQLALDEGYEGPAVVFDENDGPDWLFANFNWKSAMSVSSLEGEDE